MYEPALSTINVPVILHPYRNYGYAVVALSLIGLFMLAWNPGEVTTKALDEFALRRRLFFLKLSAKRDLKRQSHNPVAVPEKKEERPVRNSESQ